MTDSFVVLPETSGFESMDDAIADARKRVGPGAAMPTVMYVYQCVRVVRSATETRVEEFKPTTVQPSKMPRTNIPIPNKILGVRIAPPPPRLTGIAELAASDGATYWPPVSE